MIGKPGVLSELSKRSCDIEITDGFEHHGEAKEITVKFMDWNGQETVVSTARVGDSLLKTAQRFWLPIPGKCDGGDGRVGDTNDFAEGASCRFCHVQIDRAYLSKIPSPLMEEQTMLFWMDDRIDNSRCACQIILTEELDGMRVGMPSYSFMSRPGEHDGGDYM